MRASDLGDVGDREEEAPLPSSRSVAGAARLQPTLSSVARARALVVDVGARAGLDVSVTEDAALVMSELVTNAVLHARTPLEVAVRVDERSIHVEVTDTSPEPVLPPEPHATPTPRTDVFDEPLQVDIEDIISTLPTTGRGMELVGALAALWGVSPSSPHGKTVWATLALGAEGGPGRQVAAPAIDEPPPAAPGGDVALVAVPVRLALASDHQFDDALRELQVIAMAGDADPDTAALAARAAELRDATRPFRLTSTSAVREARNRGDRLVDVPLRVPADMRRLLERLGALLEDMGRARDDGKLLALPPTSEVVAFRTWFGTEVLRQLGGARLRPCPLPVVPVPEPSAAGGPMTGARDDLIQRLDADLAAAADPQAVAAAVVRRVAADVGAAFVNLLLVEPDGRSVVTVDRTGYPPDEPEGRRYPVSHDNPISEAVRTARPVVLRTREERLDRYPGLVPSAPIEANPTAVWVPLGQRPPASGVLVVGFSRSRDFTDDDLHFLVEVGRVIALRLTGS